MILPEYDWTLLSRLCVAAVCGAVLGLERELARKPVGLRTNMLIALGSALFTFSSISLTSHNGDPSRIASQIVTGVGFLGAGTILHSRDDIVKGLTSAATVWVVAALGVLAGSAHFSYALSGTVLAFLVLSLMSHIEARLLASYARYEMKVEARDREGILSNIQSCFRRVSLSPESIDIEPPRDGLYYIDIHYSAMPLHHKRLVRRMREITGVTDLSVRMM